MRSTGFVVLSIMVHCLAVAAIALHPQHISEPQGEAVEITTGEDSTTPGAADAPAEKVTEAPPKAEPKAEVKAPVAPPQPAPVVEKPVEKPVAKVAKPAAPKKVAVAKKAAVQKAEPVEKQPENLDPAISEDVQTAPVEQQAEQTPAETQEEVKPLPVKETAQASAAAEEETEAAASESAKPVDPVAAAAPAGASDEINNLTQGGDLGHGGATKAGAVDYAELKQMSGNRAPAYPFSARRDRRQGNVELLYHVTKAGTVTDVQVATSSGSDDLDKEAVRAISKFRFVPGQEGWARHPVQFNLKGDTAAAPSRLRTKVGAQDQE